jgi:pyruvate formate lyase activating enzyme
MFQNGRELKMIIGGLQKFSIIDFPKKIAAVVFTQGCPFRCHYCHNPSLVLPKEFTPPISESSFFKFLLSRKTLLDGIVITGGEPTIQKDLLSFIRKVRSFGFDIKLDTSGIHPEIIVSLLQDNLIDYIAMDIKTCLSKYKKIISTDINIDLIEQSIDIIMSSSIPYEFRTTILPSLHTTEDIISIFRKIKGAKKYFLQCYQQNDTVNPKYSQSSTFSHTAMKEMVLCSKDYNIGWCQHR